MWRDESIPHFNGHHQAYIVGAQRRDGKAGRKMSVHVAPRGKKWSVRKPGREKALRLFVSRGAAIAYAIGVGMPVYIFSHQGVLSKVLRGDE